MNFRICLAAAAAALTLSGPAARGQGPAAVNRPPVSPYLNLLRGGNPTFLNYYGLVRPQVDAQQAFQALQGQVQTLGVTQAAVGVDGQALPATGVPFGYFTHRAYFLNNRGGSAGAAGAGYFGGNVGAANRGVNAGNPYPRPQAGGYR